MISRQDRAGVAVALAAGGLLLALAGDGLRTGFMPDDMMNLYRAWPASATPLLLNDRPFGALIYRCLYLLFGLNPLPYRVFCFGLLLANLALLYLFCVRLSGSREVAALACLVGAYHAHLADLYYSTGTIYDLLVYFFLLLALVYYFSLRETGRYLNWRENAAMMAFYLLALGSKEMAVALPLYIALYEWLYGTRRSSRFLWVSVPATVLYVAYKTTGANRMTVNPAYRLHLSRHAFLTAWKEYLFPLFYSAIDFNTFKLVLLWMLLLALAIWTRRRDLIFAWFMIMAGVLPMIFIIPRGMFVIYATLPGWYLYAGVALVMLRDVAVRTFRWLGSALAVRPEQVALFAIAAALLVPWHLREKPGGKIWVEGIGRQVTDVLGPLSRQYPTMKHGARILFLSDPYPVDEWNLLFIFRLRYHDNSIEVDRVKQKPETALNMAQYDHVFEMDEKGLREVPRQ